MPAPRPAPAVPRLRSEMELAKAFVESPQVSLCTSLGHPQVSQFQSYKWDVAALSEAVDPIQTVQRQEPPTTVT